MRSQKYKDKKYKKINKGNNFTLRDMGLSCVFPWLSLNRHAPCTLLHDSGENDGEDNGENNGKDLAPTKVEKISHTLHKILSNIFFCFDSKQ